MKKLLFAIAVIAAVSFVSCTTCTNGDNGNTTGADSTFTIEKFTADLAAATDSAVVDSLLKVADAQVAKLTAEGDSTALNDLLAKIQQVIADNKEKLANLNITAAALPESLKAMGDSVFTNVADKAAQVGEELKDEAAQKVDEAAQQVNEAANKVAEKAGEGVNKAKEEAAKAANKAAEALTK
ncbi:MAG: hypothetical protein IJT30_07860 [Muribaculaceae bacterium]|nr:hypothetical protein [Muribaculaceae bacterium]